MEDYKTIFSKKKKKEPPPQTLTNPQPCYSQTIIVGDRFVIV